MHDHHQAWIMCKDNQALSPFLVLYSVQTSSWHMPNLVPLTLNKEHGPAISLWLICTVNLAMLSWHWIQMFSSSWTILDNQTWNMVNSGMSYSRPEGRKACSAWKLITHTWNESTDNSLADLIIPLEDLQPTTLDDWAFITNSVFSLKVPST